jgi:hypothetical protein
MPYNNRPVANKKVWRIKVKPIVGQKWVPKIHQPKIEQKEVDGFIGQLKREFPKELERMDAFFLECMEPYEHECKDYQETHKSQVLMREEIFTFLTNKNVTEFCGYRNKALILFWKALEYPEFSKYSHMHLAITCMMIYMKQMEDYRDIRNLELSFSIIPENEVLIIFKIELAIIGLMWQSL